MNKTVDKETLVRKHLFGGVDYISTTDESYVVFMLDGTNYIAKEDEDDGYRSCCEEFEITCLEIKNKFKPVEVLCVVNSDNADILEIYDFKNGKLIMRIGTENTNDYYPWFEFEYKPENMSVNSGVEK